MQGVGNRKEKSIKILILVAILVVILSVLVLYSDSIFYLFNKSVFKEPTVVLDVTNPVLNTENNLTTISIFVENPLDKKFYVNRIEYRKIDYERDGTLIGKIDVTFDETRANSLNRTWNEVIMPNDRTMITQLKFTSRNPPSRYIREVLIFKVIVEENVTLVAETAIELMFD